MGIAAIPYQTTISPAVQNAAAFGSNVEGIYNGALDIFTPPTTNTSDGLAHTILITNSNAIDLSSFILVIVGTNFNGDFQTETLSGPDSLGTVSSSLYYKSLSYITLNTNDGSNTLDLGFNTGVITKAYLPTWASNYIELNTSTPITGYTVQYTRSPIIEAPTGNYVAANYVSSSNWIWMTWAATTAGVYQSLYCPTAFRFEIPTYTNGQTLTFAYSQPRNY
jgi:hypothetical protein